MPTKAPETKSMWMQKRKPEARAGSGGDHSVQTMQKTAAECDRADALHKSGNGHHGI